MRASVSDVVVRQCNHHQPFSRVAGQGSGFRVYRLPLNHGRNNLGTCPCIAKAHFAWLHKPFTKIPNLFLWVFGGSQVPAPSTLAEAPIKPQKPQQSHGPCCMGGAKFAPSSAGASIRRAIFFFFFYRLRVDCGFLHGVLFARMFCKIYFGWEKGGGGGRGMFCLPFFLPSFLPCFLASFSVRWGGQMQQNKISHFQTDKVMKPLNGNG